MNLRQLQKRLSTALIEVKNFLQENANLLMQNQERAAVPSEWNKMQTRIKTLRKLCYEMHENEKHTGKGSVELYWQARLRELSREKLNIYLEGKQLEMLCRAAVEIGKRLQSFIPPERLQKLLRAEMSEGEVAQLLSQVSAQNLRLLQELEIVEKKYQDLKKETDEWNIATETVDAAVSLQQFEEKALTDKDWMATRYAENVLQEGWTLRDLKVLEKERSRIETQMAQIHADFELVQRIHQEFGSHRSLPEDRSELAAHIEKCVTIAQKHWPIHLPAIPAGRDPNAAIH